MRKNENKHGGLQLKYKKANQDYLTVKEAAKLTGKSESTVRRLLRQITSQTGSRLPSQIIKKETTVAGFIYRIDKEFILGKLGVNDQPLNRCNDQSLPSQNDQPLDHLKTLQNMVEFLQEQLQIKDTQLQANDKQIEALNNTVDQLIERARETNILLKNFQEKTLLLESSEQKNMQAQKNETKPKEKKKDFLSMLFGW